MPAPRPRQALTLLARVATVLHQRKQTHARRIGRLFFMPSQPRTFGALVGPHTYMGASPGAPLVGRLVANTGFLRALCEHGRFDRYMFFVGENADAQALDALVVGQGWLPHERLVMRNVLELPGALAAGDVTVMHHASHVDQFVDLIGLRNRLGAPVPITAQIHSLSYPRFGASHVLALLEGPRAFDAVVCSSVAGQRAIDNAFDCAAAYLRARGLASVALACERPVVPLGIDPDACAGGDRARGRARIGVPADATILLSLGRFSEHDKMDLFPVIEVFRRLQKRGPRALYLVLAGASQGTRTAEMVTLWAQALGVADRVRVLVDIPDADKPDLLAASDVFIAPSDNVQETFGLSVVEAMAAGLLVVASDFDGYRDTVTDDVGLRVKTRWASDVTPLGAYGSLLYERPLHLYLGQSIEVDLQDLEAKLALAVDDAGLRARLGQRARTRARERFAWPSVIAAFDELWDRLAAAATRDASGLPALGLDHARVFAHYPSEGFDEARVVRRTELGRLLVGERNHHPVYPDLKNLVEDADVKGVLEVADVPCALGDLRRAARGLVADRLATHNGVQDALVRYRADFLVGWLLKHGLVG